VCGKTTLDTKTACVGYFLLIHVEKTFKVKVRFTWFISVFQSGL